MVSRNCTTLRRTWSVIGGGVSALALVFEPALALERCVCIGPSKSPPWSRLCWSPLVVVLLLLSLLLLLLLLLLTPL